MSVYSTDSLEDTNKVSPRYQDSLRGDNDDFNLASIKISTDLCDNVSIQSKPTHAVLIRRQVSATQNLYSEGKSIPIFQNLNSLKREEGSLNKRLASGCPKRSTRMFPTKRSCCPKENPMSIKSDKKLGNVLTPRIQQARKPRSYLELYRQRFNGPRCNVRSPEGSTLSIFGDSQQEQLTDDDTRSPGTPRDDRSELSFYRRIIEGGTTAGSSETVHQHVPEGTNNSGCLDRVRRNASDDKSKSSGYRPYTIEDYRSLPIPKLDRSLGPDKVEMQAKREWLMRRRSYGNSVSEYNRQRTLLQTQELKSKHVMAQKCFLPPLKDLDADSKTQDDSLCPTIFEDAETLPKNSAKKCNKYSKRNVDVGKIFSSSESKKFERKSSFNSRSKSRDVIEDSYLESLRQRHLHEKEMVDRIINRAPCL
ncbi:uncharacterized protein LOC128875167 [Hylaeus volcanicus]|uniref:uncharacterized protein LOC128875167 n=1 Tax=Hylaeus volcanicus TaxID=313075 RepID=UPI0023B7BF18|nr:uncharacterized protein LOC128875167 [Hylaeus volcanicus]